MKVTWTGVYPAVTTNFHEDESLDLVTFKRNIEQQISAGVDGIIVCGSLGESGVLTHAEKQQVLISAIEASNGRVPVIICLAESTTREAIAFAKESEKNGADGFMLLPPMRYASDDRETLTYLHKVADSTDLPVMLYNNPLAYKTLITIDMFKELAQNPKFESVKESTGDIRYMTDMINELGDRFKILSGVDNLALESLMMGADGWVAGLVCAFPAETVAIYRLAQEGRYQEALEIYRWFYPLLHLDVSEKLVQNIKLAEAMTGMGTEHVREPRLKLSGEERASVVKVIETALANRPELPELAKEVLQ